MKAWTISAMNGYYRDPPITFLNVGHQEGEGGRVAIKGYYIV
jgi:hypothetical protein